MHKALSGCVSEEDPRECPGPPAALGVAMSTFPGSPGPRRGGERMGPPHPSPPPPPRAQHAPSPNLFLVVGISGEL